jgi:hypothetical protein
MRLKTQRGRTMKGGKVRNFLGPEHAIVSTTPIRGNGIETGSRFPQCNDDTHLSPVGAVRSEVMSVCCSRAECSWGYGEGR